jgi:hypothetical protein
MAMAQGSQTTLAISGNLSARGSSPTTSATAHEPSISCCRVFIYLQPRNQTQVCDRIRATAPATSSSLHILSSHNGCRICSRHRVSCPSTPPFSYAKASRSIGTDDGAVEPATLAPSQLLPSSRQTTRSSSSTTSTTPPQKS